MNKRHTYLALILIMLISSTAYPQRRILLGYGGYDHPMAATAEKILKEAYSSIGVSIDLEEFPPERFQVMGDLGRTEGILFGGESISKKFTNLAKIPVPLGYDDIVVFTKDVSFTVKNWDSLRPYKIGIMIGMPEIEKFTARMRIEAVANPRQLFLKLDQNRTDIVVLPKLLGMKTLKEMKLSSIKILPGRVDRWGLYHYLHKDSKLIPEITKALEKMNDNGRIKFYNQQMENELLK